MSKTYVRYELQEERSGTEKGKFSRHGSTLETDEKKAIAELKAKAKDVRDYTNTLSSFIDCGKHGKMRIVRCDITVLEENI